MIFRYGLEEFDQNLEVGANCLCPCCVSGYHNDVPMAFSKEYRTEMVDILTQTLQHKPDERLDMFSVHSRLVRLKRKYSSERISTQSQTPLARSRNATECTRLGQSLGASMEIPDMGTSWLQDFVLGSSTSTTTTQRLKTSTTPLRNDGEF